MSPKEILRRDAWTVRAPRIDYGAGASVKEPSVTWLRSHVTKSWALRSPGPGALSVIESSVARLRSHVSRNVALRSPGPGPGYYLFFSPAVYGRPAHETGVMRSRECDIRSQESSNKKSPLTRSRCKIFSMVAPCSTPRKLARDAPRASTKKTATPSAQPGVCRCM